ncbi:hypothetical protein SI65_04827 [Aspergillus cristatus]|uniref:Uncharacterized protein n=1 Tax=Aspergillus cristatus TaxID=573508 RepID=A0A1E3BGC9_ASPCR|nr:hypothetical protein SI65_04827 [Aspergillus cristatus]
MPANLYKYQRYRWLGDPEKLAMRYREFHLASLVNAATKITGSSKDKCTKLVKCVEGQYNKAFALIMESGDEMIHNDWQRVSVAPPLLQRPFPQMLELSGDEADERTQPEKELLEHYQEAIKATDPLRSEVLKDFYLRVRAEPISLVPCCWDRESLFSLLHALIAVIARWDDISNGKSPCPIDFTQDELQQHETEMELIEGVSSIVQQLQDEGLIPLGVMVRPDARDVNDHFKKEFMDLAEDERQRELHAKVWPYQ